MLAAAPAKKAHRVTSFNNDHGGIAKGRMRCAKILEARHATCGDSRANCKSDLKTSRDLIGQRKSGHALAVLRMFGTNAHTRTKQIAGCPAPEIRRR